MQKRRIAATALIVVLAPALTFFAVFHDREAQRAEANARIVAVENEAADRAAAVAAASHRSDVAQCEYGNQFRAADMDTWQSVFALLHQPSVAERALLAKIRKKDRPRDCAALTPPKGP